MASFKVNSTDLFAQAKQGVAKNLLAAAVFFQTQLMKELGARTPATKTIKKGRKKHRVFIKPFSAEGEYPMKRTGFLQANILYEPTKVADVVGEGMRVRVGYGRNAFYGAVLEFKLKRLGLMRTLKDLQPQLSKLAASAVTIK